MKTALVLALCVAGSAALAEHDLAGRDQENGQRLYATHCASCHGTTLEGQADWQNPDETGVLPAPPHDESGHTWHHDTTLLFDYTRLGGAEALAAMGVADFVSGMPSFAGTLSDTDILDILGYIWSTWPQHIQDIQSDRNGPHNEPATR